MKKRTITLTILLLATLYIILLINPFEINIKTPSTTNNSVEANDMIRDFSNLKSPNAEPRWWNLTYHYRRPVVITEPGAISRTNEPVRVTLTFEPKKAHKNSIRLLYYNGTSWIGPLPVQVEKELYPDLKYIKTANITFLANVSKSTTETYYIYYTDYFVEPMSYSTDIYANASLISNSYFTWWISPPNPPIFRYPNNTGVDWNTIDNGWIGYPDLPDWYGAEFNSTKVELLYSDVLEQGPIYAKVLHRYKVEVYREKTGTPPTWTPYYNYYAITFTVYAKNPFVKVDFKIESAEGSHMGVWGTVMDVDGDRGDDKCAFFTNPVTVYDVDLDTYKEAKSSLDDLNGWTWAALYESGGHGIGVIVHKDYTPDYYPLYVSRAVSGVVNGYTFIFACISSSTGQYYYRFFDVSSDGNAWDPVSETTSAIAFPLSVSVDVEQEAYYLLDIMVVDMLSRGIGNANVLVYDLNDPSDILGTNLTSPSGEASIKFYRNRTLTAVIEVNYTTENEIYVEKNGSVSLSDTDIRNPVSLTLTLDLADLYVYVENLDEKRVVGANVSISYLNYNLSSVTDSQGIVVFYRILGQVTWSINVTYTASFDIVLINDTETVLVDEGSEEVSIMLQMSDLQITAVDLLDEVVNEYTVFLYQGAEPSGDPLDSKTTGNGVVVFEDLPVGNFTLTFKYLANPKYGDNLSPTVVDVRFPSNRNIVVTLPLATMHIVVVDVNNVSIPGATVYISNEDIPDFYMQSSGSSGIANFTRILFNVTWDVRVSFEPFEGKAETIDKTLYDIPLDLPEKYVYIELPVTDMVIHVLTEQQRGMDEYWKYGVGGAVVYANITGEMVLISNATDSAGYAVAKFVPVGRYNVTVYFLEQSWSHVFDVYNNSALQFVLPFKYAQITTRLSATYPTSPYINVTWTENITVELTFYVVETNTFIANGWINWSLVDLQGNIVLSGFGIYDEGRKVYIVSFNSSEVLAGHYTLKIYGGKATYPPPTTEVMILVDISKVPTELIFEKEKIEVPVGHDYVTVRMFYRDVFHDRSIVNASIILILENQSFQAVPDEEHPGWYVCDLPVSDLSVGVYEIRVHAEKVNYRAVERTISLRIIDVIRIGPFLIPRTLFFASLIGGVVPIVGITGFVLYRYFSVPKVVRTLNKIISKIEKGERIPLNAVSSVKSRRELISERVDMWWRSLGIKFEGVREECGEGG